MRFAMALLAAATLATPVAAQYPPMSFVDLELPAFACIVVMHPTLPASVYLPDGAEWGSFDVRVGQSPYDHWGDCWFDEPLLEAEALEIRTHDDHAGLEVLDIPVPLDAPPSADGWTTVDFVHLRGGGHADEPVLLRANVPDYTDCYLYNTFTVNLRSADITGDLTVDLTDVVLFVQALDEYRAYADLRPDGIINLSDIVVMSQGLHHQ